MNIVQMGLVAKRKVPNIQNGVTELGGINGGNGYTDES